MKFIHDYSSQPLSVFLSFGCPTVSNDTLSGVSLHCLEKGKVQILYIFGDVVKLGTKITEIRDGISHFLSLS